MVHQVVVPPKPVQNRRRRGVGEVAGGGAAECAAVCCCFPCVVVHIALLAVYKVPKRLVLKAARKRRHRLLRNNKNHDDNTNDISSNALVVNKGNDIMVLHPHRASSVDLWSYGVDGTRLEEFFRQFPENEMDEDEEGFEKEMWARFAGTGFWRSESQRQP
ncbi:uncharacterized protein LOC114168765 [Vigna unguiculata]|uniref:Uncharacterized protein n=1 Tax=Vigna unguiculata TaxID=3917 RepID=A0A4D6LI02_VIGUN|nr:uncharacterized protein LOC114168765 [Vigna unguiculata]QCD87965.1 hypothetical protein DEO72_LG3g2505 [Vigna unguiculata]